MCSNPAFAQSGWAYGEQLFLDDGSFLNPKPVQVMHSQPVFLGSNKQLSVLPIPSFCLVDLNCFQVMTSRLNGDDLVKRADLAA